MENHEFITRFESMIAGNMDDFDIIYKEMKKPIFTVIYRILGNWYDSEEIMQDLFIRIIKLSPGNIKNPRAYIFSMARNMAIDKLKSDRETLEYIDNEVSDNDEPIEDEIIYDKNIIEKAFAELNISQKEIITLRINANLKFREIAKIVNLPIGTVLTRYNRGIKQLKLIYERISKQ